MRNPGFLALVAVVTVFVLGPLLYEQGLVRFSYPDRGRLPVRGIDVSHHQGLIDWDKVARDDVAFAYIKASEGGDHRDSQFRRNSREAAQAGVATGAYHFFTLCKPGAAQATNFLSSIEGAPLTLPPAVDLEFGGNCNARPAKQDPDAELSAFMDRVQAATGRRPTIYATRDFHRFYLQRGPFADEAYWVRDLVGDMEGYRGGRTVLWQYAARGRVDGIEGPVDLNVAIRPLD